MKLFPEFDVLTVLGQGGMGTVFLVKQQSLQRLVALKMLSRDLSENPEFQERFEREAKAMAEIQHPNVLMMHEYGTRGGRQFLILEYVEGENLQQLIGAGELTFERALRLIPQICEAVHHLHKCGMVHRDLKPGNILIGKGDLVKVADFGLVKASPGAMDFTLTRAGLGMGTPHYIAPEQAQNATNSDPKSDTYSLGVIFYEMLTGKLPSGNAGRPTEGKPRKYRQLDKAILNALRHEPEDRPSDVMEFARAIPSMRLSNVTLSETPPTNPARTGKPWRTAVVGVTGTILFASLVMWLSMDRPEVGKATANTEKNLDREVEGLRNRYLLPIPDVDLPGGELFHWKASSPNIIDAIATEENDFLELAATPFFVQSFYGFRANQEIAQFGPPQEDHEIRLATRSFYLTTENHLRRRSDSLGDLGLQFETPVEADESVRTIEQGRHFAVVLTEGNRVHFAATRELWSRDEVLYREIEKTPEIVDVAVWSDTGIALTKQGRPICWKGGFGRIEHGIPPVPLVDVACGIFHFIGLDAEGIVHVWPTSERFDQKTEAVLAIPDAARNSVIRVESDVHMAVVQKADGTWQAWGEDGGTQLIEKINAIGPARDIVFRSAPVRAAGLVWIGSESKLPGSMAAP